MKAQTGGSTKLALGTSQFPVLKETVFGLVMQIIMPSQ
jgi:hypothetical protein